MILILNTKFSDRISHSVKINFKKVFNDYGDPDNTCILFLEYF